VAAELIALVLQAADDPRRALQDSSRHKNSTSWHSSVKQRDAARAAMSRQSLAVPCYSNRVLHASWTDVPVCLATSIRRLESTNTQRQQPLPHWWHVAT
jgi:hypothetical protein